MSWRERFTHYAPRAFVFLLAWAAVGLVLTAQQFMMVSASAPRLQVSVFAVAQGNLIRVLIWLPATFLVVWAFRAWPIAGRTALASTLKHLALSIFLMGMNHALRIIVFTLMVYDAPLLAENLLSRIVLSFNGVSATDVGIYWGIVGVLALKAFAQREDALELRSAHLQAALANAELRALKYQLKPHFVFNSLNAVAALIREERHREAIDALADLSMMMRTLSDAPGQDRVSLEREIEFVRRQLSIEQLRFGEKLRVAYEIDPRTLPALVPNLVLQPLVENAIKHGISRRTRPGRISIFAAPTPDGGRLQLRVLNDGPVPGPNGVKATGVGLSATHERLRHLYGEHFEMKLDLAREEDAAVTILLPFEPGPEGNISAP